MKRIVLLAAILLAGCSSMKLGTMCYIPHGVSGKCEAGRSESVAKPIDALELQRLSARCAAVQCDWPK